MLAEPSFQDGLFMIVIVLCATTVMLMLLRRRQFRNATGRDLAREQVARLRDQRDMRMSMDDLLLQLEDLQRRINAQLDTKFLKLETVIRDADDRIARLEAVAGPRPPKSAANPTPQVPSKQTADASAHAERKRPTARPGAAARNNAAASPTQPAAAAPAAQPAPVRPAPLLSAEHKRVYDMIDSGTGPLQIAEKLGMTLGEVELIMNLRGMR